MADKPKKVIDFKKPSDKALLTAVFNKLTKTNKRFTVGYVKKNGEERISHGVHKKISEVKGTGTTAMSFSEKQKKFNLYGFYEFDLTKEERELLEEMKDFEIPEKKTKAYKSFYIDNLFLLRAFGTEYSFKNNDYVLDEKAMLEFEGNGAKVKGA